mmetsp:Transcript_28845/g.54892  ORF Transcript_28845/g.54892 Transcript_28845/m.54892 type:complete len:691 (+) Transcript_28845:1645-3717(+)
MRVAPPFSDPAAGVVSVLVKLIKLGDRVEHPEIGRRIGARACGPLPAHRVAGRIPVNQTMLKPSLADLPMGHEVFGQIAGHNHPPPVVHAPRHIKLAHGRVDKLDAGTPLFPCGNLGRFLDIPGEGVPALFPVLIQDAGRVVHQVIGKFAPDQFLEEDLGIMFTLVQRAQACMPALMGADLSDGEVFRQVRGPVLTRNVAPRHIAGDTAVDEVGKPGLRRSLAQLHEGAHHLCAPVYRGPQVPIGNVFAQGPCLWRGNLPRRGQGGIHIAPLHHVPERGVNLVVPAGLGFDRPGFKQKVATKTARINALIFQRRFDFGVAGNGLRIVKARPIDRPCPRLGDQILQDLERRSGPFHQATSLSVKRCGQMFNPQPPAPFRRGPQRVDTAVADNDRDNRPPRIAGRRQRRVIAKPQIATKPENDRSVAHAAALLSLLTHTLAGRVWINTCAVDQRSKNGVQCAKQLGDLIVAGVVGETQAQHAHLRVHPHGLQRPHRIEITAARHDPMFRQRCRHGQRIAPQIKGHCRCADGRIHRPENAHVIAILDIIQHRGQRLFFACAHQVMHGSTPRHRICVAAHRVGIERIHIIGHTRTSRHLRMIWPRGREPFVKAACVEIMPLIGQEHPQGALDHHQALMRAIGFIGGEKVNIRAKCADIRKTMRCIADPVHTDKGPGGVGQRGDLRHRVDLSHYV